MSVTGARREVEEMHHLWRQVDGRAEVSSSVKVVKRCMMSV
jgi:hypothetical protein